MEWCNTEKWVKLSGFCSTNETLDFILKYSTKYRSDYGGIQGPNAWFVCRAIIERFQLHVEPIEHVTKEFVCILLVVTSKTRHNLKKQTVTSKYAI